MGPEEFEKVYGELYPRLLSYARSQLDDHAAYDVVATTFETLWRKDLSYPGGDPGSWRRITSLGYEVLKGHVSNEYRSRQRRGSLWRRLAAHHPGEETQADATAQVDGAAEAVHWLARLSENDRHVIALFNAGYAVHEMAEILGCSVAAATRRRDRAKQRLRAIVGDAGGGER